MEAENPGPANQRIARKVYKTMSLNMLMTLVVVELLAFSAVMILVSSGRRADRTRDRYLSDRTRAQEPDGGLDRAA